MSYDISMKKLIILFFALIFNQCVFALDVVYPKKNCVTINSPTTFFVGSSKESLNINGKNVELHNTGAFAHFVELSYGENIFQIKTKDESLTYVITRPYSKSKSYAKPQFVEIDDSVGVVNTDKTPLRSTPVNAGINRIVHLQKGVKLKIDGELSSFYRVVLSEGEKAWVSKTNVNLVKDKKDVSANLLSYDFTEDAEFFNFVFHLDDKVPYEIIADDIFKFKIFNINNSVGNVYEFEFPYQNRVGSSQVFGYYAEYCGNDLVFRIRKYPKINKKHPLKNITITIDPGHGGKEFGAISCLRNNEKDVVLDISKYLYDELKSRGANVFMTRCSDENVSLDERVNIANRNNSMIFLSIHSNAVPDTMDPNKHRGISIFYYNNEAKSLGASILTSMVDRLELPNDKLRQQSFAVIRNTQALSLLLEIGYMINPYDNEIIINADFQKRCAKAIADGIQNFLKGE